MVAPINFGSGVTVGGGINIGAPRSGSVQFDGVSVTTQYLSLPTSTAFSFATGDFTIETWFNAAVYKRYGVIYSSTAVFATANNITVQTDVTGSKIVIGSNGTVLFTSTGTFSANIWNHIALVRSSTSATVYLNGTSLGTFSNSTNITSDTPVIGSVNSGTFPISGYLSNFRAVKGVAVYTGAFTVPTAPLAATQSAGTNISAVTGTQTSLLLNTVADAFLTDSSTNNFTVTNNGATSSLLNPFGL